MHRDLASNRLFDERFQRPKAEHEHFLFEGIRYPASRERLVSFATDSLIDPDSLNLVRSLPDREYMDANDVWRAIGEATRRFGLWSKEGERRDDMGKEATHTDDGEFLHP